MRQIKARDIKPGMTIRWGYGDVSYQCPIVRVELFNGGQDVQGETQRGQTVLIQGGKDVMVIKEPPQPEEPKAGGARVVVGGRRFLRADDDSLPWVEPDVWDWYTWDYLCSLGHVTVIPDQGWTVPDTPEVPDRIEEWPEDDTALRPYPWRDRDGDIWSWAEAKAKWKCHDHMGVYRTADHWPSSLYAPFTRDSDA